MYFVLVSFCGLATVSDCPLLLFGDGIPGLLKVTATPEEPQL